MPAIALHFWDWSRPVLAHAVEDLMQRWRRPQLDLTDSVIVVPTAESCRRLREALAVAAAEKGGAVMAPHVWSPEVVLTWQVERETVATPLQELFVWTAVLEAIPLEEFSQLFPTPPVLERRAWACGTARTLVNLRRTAGAGGLSFREIANRLAQSEDASRWQELAALETRVLGLLEKLGVRDMQAVKRAAAAQPALPEGARRVQVLALMDPPPLVRTWLVNAAERWQVDVFVHAPESECARFDALGVPLVKAWKQDAPPLDLAAAQLHLENQPEEQAQKAVSLLRRLLEQGAAATVGLADASLAPHVVGALAAEGVRAYDPAGKAAGQHPLLEVLRTWQRVHQTRTWRQLAIFLRHDDVLRVVCRGDGLPQAKLLSLLDEFFAERLPATVEEALELSRAPIEHGLGPEELAHIRDVLVTLEQRLAAWDTADAPEALRSLLGWIYGERDFPTEADPDRGYVHLLGEAMRLVQEAHAAAQQLGIEARAGELVIPTALAALESESLTDPRGEVDLVLHGWLELHWEPAPGLVICGFNDASVPGTLMVDAFLPDHVCERLGLACQATRCARDAYLLTALHFQRQAHGALHLVLGQTNEEGDVLRPSRLLFACDDEVLPARVQHLFPELKEAPAARQPARTLAWQLRPWHVKMRESVSTSLLSSYLRCPLRCYLEKFIGMEAVDASQREMSAGVFGELVHEVLRAFGKDEVLRDCFGAEPIAAFFDKELDRITRERWGTRPLLSTALQIETARQRLRHAAVVQASLRADGWRIMDVERDLNPSGALQLGGLPFKARADRVDVNTRDGTLRVWDYKTRHKRLSPKEAHCSRVRAEALEDATTKWKCFRDAKGSVRQWTDLQLPLYVWALRALQPDAPKVEAAYFHLPAAVTETGAEVWTNLDEELCDSARCCAEAVVERLKRGEFWPPAEEASWDAFEELFLGEATEAVAEPMNWKGGVS